MSECGGIKGAYCGQDVNVGWYGYQTSRRCYLRYGPGDHYESVVYLNTGVRIGIQSTRNPDVKDNPPKRPTHSDSQGRHWAWAYTFEGRHVGWIRVACLDELVTRVPWAHGPNGKDFHVGSERARKGPRTSCNGSRRNKVRVIDAPHVKLRYAPGNTAFHWLRHGDTVRELFRRSFDDYAAVIVMNSDLTEQGTRGWIKVSALADEKVTGVDVSNLQGHIDFMQVKGSGERFVICKASEGGDFVDHTFLGNVSGARAAKLEVGAYHFLRPRAGRTGTDEANHFLSRLKAAQLGKGDIRPSVDVEVTTLGAAATEIYVGQFVGALRMARLDAMLYTFPSFMEWTRTFSTDLWVAHFGVRRPTIPPPWKDYAIWQYTSDARIPGIDGKVDRDKCPDLSRIIQR